MCFGFGVYVFRGRGDNLNVDRLSRLFFEYLLIDLFVSVNHAVDGEVFFDVFSAVGAVDLVDFGDCGGGLVGVVYEEACFAVGDDFAA